MFDLKTKKQKFYHNICPKRYFYTKSFVKYLRRNFAFKFEIGHMLEGFSLLRIREVKMIILEHETLT